MRRIRSLVASVAWALGGLAPSAWSNENVVDADIEAVPVIPAEPLEPLETGGEPLPRRPPSGRLSIEEIVVTAQKREENLQDVPISINAFSADVLDAKGVFNIDGLPSITPGLTINNLAGFSILYLRGIGTDAFLMADPSVATYIDGIYNPFTQGLAQDLGALERIEVLKGPQGTLFGRNAVGGAINVMTKDPGPEAETSVQVSYASFNNFRARLYTNIPLTDTLAISVSGVLSDTGSYYDGVIGGEPIPNDSTRGARFKIGWAPTDNFDLVLSALSLRLDGIGSYVAPTGEPSPLLGSLLLIRPQQDYNAQIGAPSYSRIDNNIYYGQARLQLDGFDIKLLGSVQDIVSSSLYDFDGSPMPLVGFNPDHFFGDITTGELQLLSNAGSWGSDWLQWIVGGYYFDGRQGFTPIDLIVAEIDLAAGRLLGVQIPPLLSGLLDPFQALLNLPSGRITVNGVLDTESLSAFGQFTAAMTDWFSLTFGVRYQDEKRILVESSAGLQGDDGGAIVNYLNFAQRENTTRSVKPKVSLDFRPLGNTLLYVSYQEAIKTATYNAVNVLGTPALVEPEDMTAYELGLKTDFFGGHMRLNTAIFDYEIDNIQVQFVSLLNGGVVSFENAGSARIRGIDFDTTIELFPRSVEALVMTLSGAYIPHAKYTDYRNASGYRPVTGLYSANNDYTGNRTVRTPKFSGNAGLSKTFFVNTGSIELASDIYYNAGFSYLAQGCELAYACEPSYYTVNARVSYLHEPWGLRLTLFGHNVTDEKYTNSKFVTDFGAQWYLAPPASYGVRLNWDF